MVTDGLGRASMKPEIKCVCVCGRVLRVHVHVHMHVCARV